jgi:hypothetical protein
MGERGRKRNDGTRITICNNKVGEQVRKVVQRVSKETWRGKCEMSERGREAVNSLIKMIPKSDVSEREGKIIHWLIETFGKRKMSERVREVINGRSEFSTNREVTEL